MESFLDILMSFLRRVLHGTVGADELSGLVAGVSCPDGAADSSSFPFQITSHPTVRYVFQVHGVVVALVLMGRGARGVYSPAHVGCA